MTPYFEEAPHFEKMEPRSRNQTVFYPKCANALSVWCLNTEASTSPCGPPLSPSPPRSGVCRKPSTTGFASTKLMQACAMASDLTSAPASKTSSGKSRHRGSPLHSRSADEGSGIARCSPGQGHPYDSPRQGCGLPAVSGQPSIQSR